MNNSTMRVVRFSETEERDWQTGLAPALGNGCLRVVQRGGSSSKRRDNQGYRRRVGEVAPLVKCLPLKHEDLSLIPRTCTKKSGAMVHTW